MLTTIRDDTWYVLNMHITPYSRIWNYSDIPGGHKKIKGTAHMVEKTKKTKKLATNWRERGFVKTQDNTQRTLMHYKCTYD